MENMYSIRQRSTKDLDALVREITAEKDKLERILQSIIDIDLNDGVQFEFDELNEIHDQRKYPGYRGRFTMRFIGEQTRDSFDLDIGVGDVITPKAIKRELELVFSEEKRKRQTVEVLTYPFETILAEKLEIVLNRGIRNTRMKDFYDLRLLLNDPNRPDISNCAKAFKNTWTFRHESLFNAELFDDWQFILEDIRENNRMAKTYWSNYAKDREYAQGIAFDEIVDQIIQFLHELRSSL